MLSRKDMVSGHFYEEHANTLPAGMVWDKKSIYQSLVDTLAQREPNQPVWVFAYGSLMWNPLITIEEMRKGILKGWQRRFNLKLISGRASQQHPGRMLSLDHGGETQGMAFRLADDDQLVDELKVIWTREMITGLYLPRWESVKLTSGETIQAIVFVSNVAHPDHVPDESPESASSIIALAEGSIGTNTDYVMQLYSTLQSWCIEDPYIQDVVQCLNHS